MTSIDDRSAVHTTHTTSAAAELGHLDVISIHGSPLPGRFNNSIDEGVLDGGCLTAACPNSVNATPTCGWYLLRLPGSTLSVGEDRG